MSSTNLKMIKNVSHLERIVVHLNDFFTKECKKIIIIKSSGGHYLLEYKFYLFYIFSLYSFTISTFGDSI